MIFFFVINIQGSFQKYVDNVAVGRKEFFLNLNLTHGKIQNHKFYQQLMFQLIWLSRLYYIWF